MDKTQILSLIKNPAFLIQLTLQEIHEVISCYSNALSVLHQLLNESIVEQQQNSGPIATQSYEAINFQPQQQEQEQTRFQHEFQPSTSPNSKTSKTSKKKQNGKSNERSLKKTKLGPNQSNSNVSDRSLKKEIELNENEFKEIIKGGFKSKVRYIAASSNISKQYTGEVIIRPAKGTSFENCDYLSLDGLSSAGPIVSHNSIHCLASNKFPFPTYLHTDKGHNIYFQVFKHVKSLVIEEEANGTVLIDTIEQGDKPIKEGIYKASMLICKSGDEKDVHLNFLATIDGDIKNKIPFKSPLFDAYSNDQHAHKYLNNPLAKQI